MYEKPQYFTKDGFKRLARNPHTDSGKSFSMLSPKPGPSVSRTLLQKKLKGPGISDEAARLIAQVLKGMLK